MSTTNSTATHTITREGVTFTFRPLELAGFTNIAAAFGVCAYVEGVEYGVDLGSYVAERGGESSFCALWGGTLSSTAVELPTFATPYHVADALAAHAERIRAAL